jgi:hypothetical protein
MLSATLRIESNGGSASDKHDVRRAARVISGIVIASLLIVAAGAAAQAVGPLSPSGRASGLVFAPGPDSDSACNSNPCGSVSVLASGQAHVSLSLGIESAGHAQAATYYTDLLELRNSGGSSLPVTSVKVTGVTSSSASDFGQISVYYCSSDTDTPGADCQGSITISANSGGALYGGTDFVPAGGVRYIEFVGFAGPSAHAGDTISFTLEVTGGTQQ